MPSHFLRLLRKFSYFVKKRPLVVYSTEKRSDYFPSATFENTRHTIDFENTKSIAIIEHKTKRIIGEATEIEKHLNTTDDTEKTATQQNSTNQEGEAAQYRTRRIRRPPLDQSDTTVHKTIKHGQACI